jgi:hypothetical protein
MNEIRYMSKRQEMICNIAEELAKKSDMEKSKHGAVIVNGKKIIGMGYNRYCKNKKCYSDHAEVDAILNAIKNYGKESLYNSELYVVRISKGGNIAKQRQTMKNRGMARQTMKNRGMARQTMKNRGMARQTMKNRGMVRQTMKNRGMTHQTMIYRGMTHQTMIYRGMTRQTMIIRCIIYECLNLVKTVQILLLKIILIQYIILLIKIILLLIIINNNIIFVGIS